MTVKRKPSKAADNIIVEQRMRAADAQQMPVRRTRRDDAVRNGASGREAAGSDNDAKRHRRATMKRRRWPWIALAILVVLVIVAAGAFSWDRWFRYDDADDFVGEWSVVGEPTTVVIDGQTIELTDGASFPYTLDTGAKTIEFTFGNWSGEGRYRFSSDRSQLVIVEEGDCSWSSTLFDDIALTFDDLVRAVQGRSPIEYSTHEGMNVLSRLPHDTTASSDADPGRLPIDTDSSEPPASEEPPDGAASTDGSGHLDDSGSAEGGQADDAYPDTETPPGYLFDVDDA